MGLLLAYGHILPAEVTRYDFSMYVLYVLMFLVGMSIGNDFKVLQALKEQNCRIFCASGYYSGNLGRKCFGECGVVRT
jgi:uncharacterized membrane protein YbjE (DUF340 family)